MSPFRRAPLIAGLVTLAVAGCRAPSASHAAALAAADVAALHAVDTAFAAATAAGDADAVAGLYAEDAHLLPPDAPVVAGRDGIRRFWAGLLDAYRVTIELGADEIDGRGDLAYVRGHYTMSATPKSSGVPPIHETGKFLEVLRRGADGRWRYAEDMYSADAPAPK